jgi:hypothetical protein
VVLVLNFNFFIAVQTDFFLLLQTESYAPSRGFREQVKCGGILWCVERTAGGRREEQFLV